MNLPHENVRDLVVQLRDDHLPGFHVLPYNRFDIEHSQHWWLSPTGDKAAYPYAKAIFTTDDWVEPGEVFCGFNVEKGIAHEGDWNKNCVMSNSWFWHRFLEIANTPFSSAIEQARQESDADLQIIVASGMLVPNAEWAHVCFDIAGSDLTQARYKAADGCLSGVAACGSITELADTLRTLDANPFDWQWIDLMVGRTFTLDLQGPDHTANLAAILKPFDAWMRQT